MRKHVNCNNGDSRAVFSSVNLTLLEKIKKREANVAVIGLGYVGLPLAVEFARSGYNVLGVDIAKNKIEQLKRGESYILDVKNEDLKEFICNRGTLRVSSDYAILKNADTFSITVPTPLRKTKDPDISYIVSAIDGLLPFLVDKENFAIILESTTYPGTTRELIYDRLRSLYPNLIAGKNIFIAFSPERVDPGNPTYNTRNTPKVIGGITSCCTEVAVALYGNVMTKIITVGSAEVAEMVKLLENTFRAVNIALVNELLLMCDRMSINVWEVIDAAKTKPFGFMPFYPGPGIGGHCIPLDPLYLSWKAKSFDFYNRFIELASDINGNMPRFTVNKLHKILNEQGKALKNAKILLLGMSYKKDINDVRESPGLEIYRMLREEYFADVSYHDPHVPSFMYLRADGDDGSDCDGVTSPVVRSCEMAPHIVSSFDCILLLVDHSGLDYQMILANAKLILDTRNARWPVDKHHSHLSDKGVIGNKLNFL